MLREQRDYRDAGCELAPSCLECSLPHCVHDEPGGERQQRKRERNRQIARLRRTQGVKIAEFARRFRVSRRTIYRILARSGQGEDSDD